MKDLFLYPCSCLKRERYMYMFSDFVVMYNLLAPVIFDRAYIKTRT